MLSLTVFLGKIEAVELLLWEAEASLLASDANRWSSLDWAIEEEPTEVIQVLCASQALAKILDVARDDDGKNALKMACANGFDEIAVIFVNAGADLRTVFNDYDLSAF